MVHVTYAVTLRWNDWVAERTKFKPLVMLNIDMGEKFFIPSPKLMIIEEKAVIAKNLVASEQVQNIE